MTATERPFQCDLCPKNYCYASGLQNHQQSFHCNRSLGWPCCQPCSCCGVGSCGCRSNGRCSRSHSTRTMPYRCHLCGDKCSINHPSCSLGRHDRKRYSSKRQARCNAERLPTLIRNHSRKNRKDSDRHLYQCNVCQKKFSKKSTLQEHLQTHREYVCNICSKTFAGEDRLNDHIKYHHNEKPFHCNVCDKRFKRKSHLNTHKESHAGNSPFQCLKCAKYYIYRSSLRRHLNKHNNEESSQKEQTDSASRQ